MKAKTKWDANVTWIAEFVNSSGCVMDTEKGPREVVESQIKAWVPILIEGDVIRLNKVSDE